MNFYRYAVLGREVARHWGKTIAEDECHAVIKNTDAATSALWVQCYQAELLESIAHSLERIANAELPKSRSQQSAIHHDLKEFLCALAKEPTGEFEESTLSEIAQE